MESDVALTDGACAPVAVATTADASGADETSNKHLAMLFKFMFVKNSKQLVQFIENKESAVESDVALTHGASAPFAVCALWPPLPMPVELMKHEFFRLSNSLLF